MLAEARQYWRSISRASIGESDVKAQRHALLLRGTSRSDPAYNSRKYGAFSPLFTALTNAIASPLPDVPTDLNLRGFSA